MDNNEIIQSHQVLSDIAVATFGHWVDDNKNIYNINDFYDRIKAHISNNIDYTFEKTKVDKQWYKGITDLCNALINYQTFRETVYHFNEKYEKIHTKYEKIQNKGQKNTVISENRKNQLAEDVILDAEEAAEFENLKANKAYKNMTKKQFKDFKDKPCGEKYGSLSNILGNKCDEGNVCVAKDDGRKVCQPSVSTPLPDEDTPPVVHPEPQIPQRPQVVPQEPQLPQRPQVVPQEPQLPQRPQVVPQEPQLPPREEEFEVVTIPNNVPGPGPIPPGMKEDPGPETKNEDEVGLTEAQIAQLSAERAGLINIETMSEPETSLRLLNEGTVQEGGFIFGGDSIKTLKTKSKKITIPPKPVNINEQNFKSIIKEHYDGDELDIFMDDFKNTIKLLDAMAQFKKILENSQVGGYPKTIHKGQDISISEKTALNEWESQFKEQQEKTSMEIQTAKSDCEGKQQKADEKADSQEKEEKDRQHELDKIRETTKINAEAYKESLKEIQEIIEKAKQEILAKKAECQAVESSKEVDKQQIKDIEEQQQDVKSQITINEDQMKILTDKIDSLKDQRSNTTTTEQNEKITREINEVIIRKETVENHQNTLVGMQTNLSTLKTNSEDQLSDKDRQMKEMQDMIKNMQENINKQKDGPTISTDSHATGPVFNFGDMIQGSTPGSKKHRRHRKYDDSSSDSDDSEDERRHRKKKKKKKKKKKRKDDSDSESDRDSDDSDKRDKSDSDKRDKSDSVSESDSDKGDKSDSDSDSESDAVLLDTEKESKCGEGFVKQSDGSCKEVQTDDSDKGDDIVKQIDEIKEKIKLDFNITYDNWPGGFLITDMTVNAININNINNIPRDIIKPIEQKSETIGLDGAAQDNKEKAKNHLKQILEYLKKLIEKYKQMNKNLISRKIIQEYIDWKSDTKEKLNKMKELEENLKKINKDKYEDKKRERKRKKEEIDEIKEKYKSNIEQYIQNIQLIIQRLTGFMWQINDDKSGCKDIDETLKIEVDCSKEGKKTANKNFKKLSKKYHPDKNPGNKEVEEKFKQMNVCYKEAIAKCDSDSDSDIDDKKDPLQLKDAEVKTDDSDSDSDSDIDDKKDPLQLKDEEVETDDSDSDSDSDDKNVPLQLKDEPDESCNDTKIQEIISNYTGEFKDIKTQCSEINENNAVEQCKKCNSNINILLENFDTIITKSNCNEAEEIVKLKKEIGTFLEQTNEKCKGYLSKDQIKQVQEDAGKIVKCRRITLQALATMILWKHDIILIKQKEWFVKKIAKVHGKHLPKTMTECIKRHIKVYVGKDMENLRKNFKDYLNKLRVIIKKLQNEKEDVKKCKVLAKELQKLLNEWKSNKLKLDKQQLEIISKCLSLTNRSVINNPTISSYYNSLWSAIIQTRTANQKKTALHIAALDKEINSDSYINKNDIQNIGEL